MSDVTEPLRSGGRFAITMTTDTVTKRGDPRALAREAAGLRLITSRRLGARLISAARGVVVTERIDGAHRQLADLDASEAAALGRFLRALHDSRRSATGGLPHWPTRVRSLASYRRGRERDALAAAGTDRGLAERIVAAAAAPAPVREGRPFRLLHGDLVAENILWSPSPRLIDFEFWRMGDPAEDLAYLVEVNGVPNAIVAAMLDGYAHRGVADRLDGWRPLCALDAGLWYRAASQPQRAADLLARATRGAGLAPT